jgi:hypothetical protein
VACALSARRVGVTALRCGCRGVLHVVLPCQVAHAIEKYSEAIAVEETDGRLFNRAVCHVQNDTPELALVRVNCCTPTPLTYPSGVKLGVCARWLCHRRRISSACCS